MSMHPLDVLNATERHRQILIAKLADREARLKAVREWIGAVQSESEWAHEAFRATDLRVKAWRK